MEIDSKKRIKEYIKTNFPEWKKVDYSQIDGSVILNPDLDEFYQIENDEVILISYTNISITGTDRAKPQFRVFLDGYKQSFEFAKKHQLRYYLLSIYTKADSYANGINNFNPKEYIISIETNLDTESSRRDLRSIYEYANTKLTKGQKFLKCSRVNYKANINQASFIYIGSEENPDKTIFENFINIFDSRPYLKSTIEDDLEFEHQSEKLPLQQIYYGAPGTGKSNAIKEMTGEKGNGAGRMFAKDFTFRTTFHPDSDYASFVGAYKPVWDGKQIVYKFRPQTFLKAYVKAWLHPDENVALVVEEINRGNCAQIFGDIFQLLDREDRKTDAIGLSKYPIETDIDMQDFLHSSFYKKAKDENNSEVEELLISDEDRDAINSYYNAHYDDAFGKIVNGEILTLPENLSILATMNTSDQSLFPMDSAFKRRWDWIYQGIVEGTEKDGITKLGWQIKIDENNTVDWWKFLRSINDEIARLTTSEDKQLGYFFCMPNLDEKTISADRFVGKVIFYLWNDIFKDYAFEPTCCKNKDNKEVLYADFYNKTDGKSIDTEVLTHFFDTLKDPDDDKQSLLKPIEEPKTNEPEQPEGQTQAEDPAVE